MKAIILTLLLVACGKDGSTGPAGPAGEVGPAGKDGAAGADGGDNGFVSVLFCQGTTNIPLNTFWTGFALTYQRAETLAGDIFISAYTGGKGDINESATAFYKKDMTGAAGRITLGAGDGNYIILEKDPVANAVLVFEGRGTAGNVAQVFTTGCTLY